MKTISFGFDDGFRRSAETLCEVFEQRGLKACFAILADPEHALDPFARDADLGDWDFWRKVMAAGHEVASHGLMHERYDELSFEEVKASVLVALEITVDAASLVPFAEEVRKIVIKAVGDPPTWRLTRYEKSSGLLIRI